jgi:hypothetical protein
MKLSIANHEGRNLAMKHARTIVLAIACVIYALPAHAGALSNAAVGAGVGVLTGAGAGTGAVAGAVVGGVNKSGNDGVVSKAVKLKAVDSVGNDGIVEKGAKVKVLTD